MRFFLLRNRVKKERAYVYVPGQHDDSVSTGVEYWLHEDSVSTGAEYQQGV